MDWAIVGVCFLLTLLVTRTVIIDEAYRRLSTDHDELKELEEWSRKMREPLPPLNPEEKWADECQNVLGMVLTERARQVARYGFNKDLEDGTGPNARWLARTSVNLDLRTATEIEAAFRVSYERHEAIYGRPTWMHLIREEVAEAFQESDPERLTTELIQVAALCVSWVERIRERNGN